MLVSFRGAVCAGPLAGWRKEWGKEKGRKDIHLPIEAC